MADHPSHLRAFLRAVHRRLVVIRALECAGLALLAGAVAGLLLLPLLLYRNQPALPTAILLLSISPLIGLVYLLFHRPTLLHAAREADRQLALDDLLITAWTATGPGLDPQFRAAIVHLVEFRCQALNPSSVLLHRLGRRSWGAIGTAAALVLTLGLLSTSATQTQASNHSPRSLLSSSSPKDPDHSHAKSHIASPSHGSPIASDHPTGSDRTLDPPGADTTTSKIPNRQGGDNGIADAPDSHGTGRGAGRTRNPDVSAVPRAPDGSTAGRTVDPNGQSASGSGAPSSSANGSSATPSGPRVGRSSSPPKLPAPWNSTQWPAARAGALEALRTNEIPASYHDLIREYFTAE